MKKKKDNKEFKIVGGQVTECKQETRDGVNIGIIEGYIATWDVDRGDWMGVKDQFKKGAFVESILDHIRRRRMIRMKDHHGRTVGGFPIEFVKEDERGLFGVAEVNLDVQQGLEAYMLAKQGVLTDFSIGFSVQEFEMEDDIRTITKAIVWEGSIVDEPMNPHANVTQVKNEDGDMKVYNTEDIKDWTKRDVEKALHEGAQFSKNAAKAIFSLNIWTDKDTEEEAATEAATEAAATKEAEQKTMQEMIDSLNSVTDGIKS